MKDLNKMNNFNISVMKHSENASIIGTARVYHRSSFLGRSGITFRSLMLALAISMVVFLGSCGQAVVEEEESAHEVLPENIVEMTSDQYKVAGIELGKVEEKAMSKLIKAAGTITVPPQNLATVCASYGGYIKSTSLMQGSPIKKGQVLAIIENPEFITIQQSTLR